MGSDVGWLEAVEKNHCFWTKWSLLVSSQISISFEINTLTIWLQSLFAGVALECSVLESKCMVGRRELQLGV